MKDNPKIDSRVPEHRSARRGAFLVEFAVVVPIVFVLGFGFIEFGRFSLARHALEEAARVGCRTAIVKGAVVADVDSSVTNTLAPFGISGHTTTISNLNVNQGDMVTVTISVPYESVRWLPTPRFISLATFTVKCSLPKEANEGS